MQRLAAALLLILSFALTGPSAAADPAPPVGHPALWRVTGPKATLYLLGSVHALPPTLQWRDARIDQAVGGADGFFFEAELDHSAIESYVAERGLLPPGESLRAMLPPEAQKDLDDDLASVGVAEDTIDTRRPWLATITMTALKMARQGDTAAGGVDIAILKDAQASGKPIRYFETVGQQMALLAPDDPQAELEEFEKFLKTYRDDSEDMGPLVAAWAAGDQRGMARLLFAEFDKYPGARKIYFDDRNRAWTHTLEDVLRNETGTFLVTVGAGHLATDRGVPALLKRDGYKVERL